MERCPNSFNSDKDIAYKMFELQKFSQNKENKIKMIISNNNNTSSLSFMICDKDIAKEFLVNKYHLFTKRIDFLLFDELAGNGILLASGQKWKNQRSLVAPLFHFQKIRDRVPSMLNSAQNLIYNLNSQYKDLLKQPENSKNNLQTILQEITGRIVIDSFFGQQNDFRKKKINGKPLALEIQSLVEQAAAYGFENPLSQLRALLIGTHSRKKLPMIFFDKNEKQFFQRADYLRDYVFQEIERRRLDKKIKKKQDEIQQDFLDLCLKSDNVQDSQTIFELFMTLFFAGMDTTANLVLISLYYLSKYQNIQNQLREEIKQVFKSDSDYLIMENYSKIVGLNKFIYEVLRIKSPVPNLIGREAIQDLYLGEFFIPKGSQVNVSFMSNNYNEEQVKDPFKFDINRPENQENINNFNFLPFSGGPRNCIGQHMGLCETKVILSKLLQTYQIQSNHEGELEFDYKFLYTSIKKNLVIFKEI